MSKAEKRLLKRRQAVEPSIGHLEAEQRMRWNFRKGALEDAMNPILAAVDFSIRWLMQWPADVWRRILSGVLPLLDQAGPVRLLNFKSAVAQWNIQN
jgi:IS5 family transposase